MAELSGLSFAVFHNIIDGKPRSSSKLHRGVDPTTGKPLWNAPVSTVEDINDPVGASRNTFPAWSSLGYGARASLLDQFADAFLELAPQSQLYSKQKLDERLDYLDSDERKSRSTGHLFGFIIQVISGAL
ncbi:unnamed protein product [Penicillium palitans]